jgi:hypothetical protein
MRKDEKAGYVRGYIPNYDGHYAAANQLEDDVEDEDQTLEWVEFLNKDHIEAGKGLLATMEVDDVEEENEEYQLEEQMVLSKEVVQAIEEVRTKDDQLSKCVNKPKTKEQRGQS